jgi:hypothetical protein
VVVLAARQAHRRRDPEGARDRTRARSHRRSLVPRERAGPRRQAEGHRRHLRHVRKLHESGDGSPAGLVAALGWETILAKTAQDALLFALDAFAKKAGLVADAGDSKDAKKEDAMPTSARTPQEARTEAPLGGGEERERRDSGLPVAIPDIPAIDSAEDEEPPSTPSGDTSTWSSSGESPKLIEARAKMMEMLGAPAGTAPRPQEAWVASDVPEKPSSLEWPEPPPVVASEEPKGGPPPLPNKGAPTPRR